MKPKSQPVTRLDYCQYLLISQINYTLTYFAEHSEEFSHDAVNRYLAGDQIRPRLVWENVKDQVVQTPEGYHGLRNYRKALKKAISDDQGA